MREKERRRATRRGENEEEREGDKEEPTNIDKGAKVNDVSDSSSNDLPLLKLTEAHRTLSHHHLLSNITRIIPRPTRK